MIQTHGFWLQCWLMLGIMASRISDAEFGSVTRASGDRRMSDEKELDGPPDGKVFCRDCKHLANLYFGHCACPERCKIDYVEGCLVLESCKTLNVDGKCANFAPKDNKVKKKLTQGQEVFIWILFAAILTSAMISSLITVQIVRQTPKASQENK